MKDFSESVMIAAQPGWRGIICSGKDDDEWWTWFLPVVAWVVVTDHFQIKGDRWRKGVYAWPLMANDDGDLRSVTLVSPDGAVYDPDGPDYQSVKEWEEAAIKEWRRRKEP
jgi:hypothetical protein